MKVVYGLLDALGTVRYVGCSVYPQRRLAKLQRTHPWAVGIVVLEEVPDGEDWRPYEKKHIAEQRKLCELENRTGGGEGGNSIPRSQKTRAKMSAAAMGHPVLQSTRGKIATGQAAAWTPERRAAQAERMRILRRAK